MSKETPEEELKAGTHKKLLVVNFRHFYPQKRSEKKNLAKK